MLNPGLSEASSNVEAALANLKVRWKRQEGLPNENTPPSFGLLESLPKENVDDAEDEGGHRERGDSEAEAGQQEGDGGQTLPHPHL